MLVTLKSPSVPAKKPADKRRPRIGVTVSAELLSLVEGFAARKQWSLSKAAEYLLEAGVNAQLSEEGRRHIGVDAAKRQTAMKQASDIANNDEMVRLLELLQKAKELGLV